MSALPRATSDQDLKSYISTEKYCLDQCAEEILVNSSSTQTCNNLHDTMKTLRKAWHQLQTRQLRTHQQSHV